MPPSYAKSPPARPLVNLWEAWLSPPQGLKVSELRWNWLRKKTSLNPSEVHPFQNMNYRTLQNYILKWSISIHFSFLIAMFVDRSVGMPTFQDMKPIFMPQGRSSAELRLTIHWPNKPIFMHCVKKCKKNHVFLPNGWKKQKTTKPRSLGRFHTKISGWFDIHGTHLFSEGPHPPVDLVFEIPPMMRSYGYGTNLLWKKNPAKMGENTC